MTQTFPENRLKPKHNTQKMVSGERGTCHHPVLELTLTVTAAFEEGEPPPKTYLETQGAKGNLIPFLFFQSPRSLGNDVGTEAGDKIFH